MTPIPTQPEILTLLAKLYVQDVLKSNGTVSFAWLAEKQGGFRDVTCIDSLGMPVGRKVSGATPDAAEVFQKAIAIETELLVHIRPGPDTVQFAFEHVPVYPAPLPVAEPQPVVEEPEPVEPVKDKKHKEKK